MTLDKLEQLAQKVRPFIVLVLDTNVLLDKPDVESYLPSLGLPAVLVIPEVVNSEIQILCTRKDQETRMKAFRARASLENLYRQAIPRNGIRLENGHWMITVESGGLGPLVQEDHPEDLIERRTLEAIPK